MCAGTTGSLLRTTMNQWSNLYAVAQIHKSNSFRTMEFMTACTEHINVHFLHVNRHMTKCLNRIRVEQNIMFFCNGTNLFNRLHRSNFIIGKHHRNQNRIRTNSFLQFVQRNQTIFIHIEISHFKAFAL